MNGRFLRESASAQGCISNPRKQFRFSGVYGTAYAAATTGSGLRGEVGDHSFVQIFFDRKSYNTERKWIQIVACVPNVIKLNLAGEPAVLLRLLPDAVRQAFGERMAEIRIKFRRIGQIET